MDLETRVKEIIADQLGVEIEKLRDDANFVQDLGADSLGRGAWSLYQRVQEKT